MKTQQKANLSSLPAASKETARIVGLVAGSPRLLHQREREKGRKGGRSEDLALWHGGTVSIFSFEVEHLERTSERACSRLCDKADRDKRERLPVRLFNPAEALCKEGDHLLRS